MRLGQGSRRRSPWWCYVVMIAAAAAVLPGAAWVAAEEEESKPETTAQPLSSQAVEIPIPTTAPARELGDTNLSAQQRENFLKAEADGKLVTIRYLDVADVLAKIRSLYEIDERQAVEKLIDALADPAVDEKERFDKDRAFWSEDKPGELVAAQTDKAFARVDRELKKIRNYNAKRWPNGLVMTPAGPAPKVMGSFLKRMHAKPAKPRPSGMAPAKIEQPAHTSVYVTADQKIPQMQVSDPEVVTVVPLSPTKIQISGLMPGTTLVHIWLEDKTFQTINMKVVEINKNARPKVPVLPHIHWTQGARSPEANSLDLYEWTYEERLLQGMKENRGYNVQGVLAAMRSELGLSEEEAKKTLTRRLTAVHIREAKGDRPHFSWSGENHLMIETVGSQKRIAAEIERMGKYGFQQIRLTICCMETRTKKIDPEWVGKEFVLLDSDDAEAKLRRLREANKAKVLAEPVLVTINGRPASFLVGGQVPSVTGYRGDKPDIKYISYGTACDFLPIMQDDGRIRVGISFRVSELRGMKTKAIKHPKTGKPVEFKNPIVYTREIETTVSVWPDQTAVLVGPEYEITPGNRGRLIFAVSPTLPEKK